MRQTILIHAVVLALFATPVLAAKPEIEREPAAPQANGSAHTVRVIPEACAVLQGSFTGEATMPYRFAPVRSSASCQPRARLVDPARAKPSAKTGWILNDVIRVPSKDCPGLQAVVEVWRKPVAATPPKEDAQGRARIYLQDAKAAATKSTDVTLYTAKVLAEGAPCR